MKIHSTLYDRFAGIYDYVFAAILDPGRLEVIRQINRLPASRILEIGVGTGLRMEKYHPRHRVTGVDLSHAMIEKAKRRKERLLLRHVEFMQMDAQQLRFDDNSFDVVVASYVVSTVERPKQVMAEMRRVCRPGGKLFVLNHFSNEYSRMEKFLLPLTRRLGWRSYFKRHQIQVPGLKLVRHRPVNLFGYWQLLEYKP